MKISSTKAFVPLFACLLLILNNLNAQQLILTPGSHFVINGNPSVILNSAAIKNNGTFTPGNGTVNFTGYSDTSITYIAGDSTTTITSFSISKSASGVAVKSPVAVTSVLTMAAGTLYANSNLTLKSTISNTARVAPLATGTSIVGKTNVERYIPVRRAWRLMTVPETNTSSIKNSWQNNQLYQAGKGTYVTAPGPSASNGIDVSPQNNYSMYSFNYTTQKYAGIANTNVNISSGTNGSGDNQGYFVFVRGDRTATNFNTGYANSTTLNSLGVLQTGTQTFTASSVSGKYTLIGNPYASPIDFSKLTRTNLVNRFYAWDPSLNAVGGYVVLDDIDGDGVYTKSIASNQTQIIQSSQAFFVQTYSNAPASLTVNESNKSTVNNSLVFRPSSLTQGLRINLNLLNADSSTSLADATVAQFNSNFSDSVDLDDALKFNNINEAISLSRYGKSLSMERRPNITANDTLFLQMLQTTKRSYQLEFLNENFASSGLTAYLQDSYLGTNTPLNLSGTSTFNFNITNDSGAIAKRFRIVFKVDAPLAVTFTTVKASQKNNGVAVQWNVENEMNIVQYEVEKSADGTHFAQANITIATGNNNSSVEYSWLDVKPVAGNNYYKVKSIDRNGVVKYSQVIRVSMGKTDNEISVYPNPVTENVMNLQFSNEPLGVYKARLINSAGQTVYTKEITVASYNTVQALSISSTLAKGNYELKTTGPGNVETVQSIIIE